MIGQVVAALKESLVGNNEGLKHSTNVLNEFSKREGYCTSLMEIIDEASMDISVKQAALIQLKNCVSEKWKHKKEQQQLSSAEKNQIKDKVVVAILRCCKAHGLIKLYRQVLATIIGFEFQTWLPISELLERLSTGENVPAVLHCIIAICTNFEFCTHNNELQAFSRFLQQILPEVLSTVYKHIANPEVIYLGLKILWKSVHHEVTRDVRALAHAWMSLVLLTIDDYNEALQAGLDETQPKNSPQFYYYHSKKWATRIMMRFVQKHAKSARSYQDLNNEDREYSQMWYQQFGLSLIQSVVKQIATPIPTIRKIRYFQLKILQSVLGQKPNLLLPYYKNFQFELLPAYMLVTAQDERTANEDVIEFFRNEDDVTSIYSNVKKAATDLWSAFMQSGSVTDRDNDVFTPGPLYQESIEYMVAKLRSQSLVEKDLGMYLLCQSRVYINRCKSVRDQMPQLLVAYVIKQLSSPVLLIRARANSLLYQYGKEMSQINQLTPAIEGVYKCLTQDSSPLVMIKASLALPNLVSQPQAKALLQPYLKQILQAYLKLISNYDMEQTVYALQQFVQHFASMIGKYAVDLFRCLTTLFVKMFNKDMEQIENEDYGSDIEMAASGCIKTMTEIIEAPLEPEVRQQLEPCFLDLCAFLFTSQSLDYTEDLLYLMRVYIYKVDRISMACWFFYQVIIYFVAGIPKQMWANVEKMPVPEANKKILSSIRGGNNREFLEYIVPVLRNYFGKGHDMIVAQKDQFKNNFVSLIFYMIGYVYQKQMSKKYESELFLDSCSILLVNFLETFPSEMSSRFLLPAWNIAKYNLAKGQSSYLKKITCQVLGVLLWRHTVLFLELLQKQNVLTAAISRIIKIAGRLQQFQERKRMILGICSFMGVVGQNLEVLGSLGAQLFPTLLRLVKKNALARIMNNTKEVDVRKKLREAIQKMDDQQEYSDENEEDDDMWDQEYCEKNISKLREVNELEVFKQTIQALGSQSPQVYAEVAKFASPEQLAEIENLLLQSLSLSEKS